MKMNNNTYDMLKWVALILLPAVVTFVVALGEIWSIPYTAQIAATIAAIDTLLGACLKVSSDNYVAKKPDDEADADDDGAEEAEEPFTPEAGEDDE